MTAAARRDPPLEHGSRVTDGHTDGLVWRVEHVPAKVGRGSREDVYVLWMPHLDDEPQP